MLDFLEILSKFFNRICKDEDTFEEKDVDDNSIDIDDRVSCPICLEYTNEKDVHLITCNHIYHLVCLKSYLNNDFTKCALCKRPITGIKEDPSFKVNNRNEDEDEGNLLYGDFFGNSFSINNLLFSSNSLFRNRRERAKVNNQTSIFSNNNDRHSSGGSNFNIQNNSNNIFGTNSIGGNLFGFNNNNSSGTGLFGSINNNNSNDGLFGRNNSLLGNNNRGLFDDSNNNISSGGNLFGTNSSGGLFGTSNNNNSNGGLFGTNNNNNSSSGLFGGNNNNNS